MEKIIIHEVGLRDGLQMEKEVMPIEVKIAWTEELFKTGVDIIQLGSFVNPTRMPQMADTADVFKYFTNHGKPDNVILSGLVLNEKGLERAMDCGVEMICMGVSASETHSKKNTGMSIAEATKQIVHMSKQAMADGKMVQGSVQSAFGCGFEGAVPEERVYDIVKMYLDTGVRMISMADTAGYANPEQVERMFSKVYQFEKNIRFTCHFHNTYGMGMTNSYAAFKAGVKSFETAIGGLGGCPFTKVAAGNVATEDCVNMFQKMNLRNDIDLEKLIELAKAVSERLGKTLPGYIHKTARIKN
jgi:hydroxymethylglutaryl-CoA lyase